MFCKSLAVFSFSAVCLAVSASASTVTVTSSSGLFTNPAPANASSGAAYNTWYANNVRSGGAVGITTARPDAGNGSIQFTAPNDSNAKADYEYYFATGTSFLLSDLTAFSYDVYRGSKLDGQRKV